MVEYSQSSTDSSIESNINIRRIAPRFEIISEINSDYSEPSYSPNSYYSNSPISSLGSNSPIRRLPTARYIPETYIDVEAQLVENDSLDRTISSQASSSIYSFFDEDNKPYLYRYIILIIWLSYLFGVLIMEKPKFNTISPANPKLYFQIISNYPNCKDTRGEIWRFFTSSLVHADIGHIIINTIILYPVMYFTELLNGRKSVITLLFLVSFYTNLIYLLLSIFLELISYLLLFSSNTAYEAHWIGFIIGFISGLIIFKDKRTRTFNIKWLIIGSNLLSYLTTFFLYSFITNWPPEINSFLSNTDLPFCCYEKLVNNVTDISCYT
jgi:membrane associated rhomboid family serine protease